MIAYVILIFFVSIVLAFTVHGAFVWLAMAALAALVIMSIIWLWLLATNRIGFFGTRRPR